MRQPLSDYLSEIARAFILSAREAVNETLHHAEKADEDLTLHIPIGGQPLKVEGAANLPSKVLGLTSVSLEQEAFMETDAKGVPHILLKRGLFAKASVVKIKMDFERTDPLESLELARDRANELGKEHVQNHRLTVTVDGAPINLPEAQSETE